MRLPFFLMALACSLPGISALAASEYYDQYVLAKPRQIDIGVQPLGYPAAMIGAVMARDGVLRQFLKSRSMTVATHPFRNGADMVPFLGSNALEFAMLGDMPTIRAAITREIDIVGLVKQSTSAVVSREQSLQQLKGQTIGYIPGTSAHHALLKGLRSVGLSELDVTLLAVPIDEMPEALEAGRIDAFSAWEPAPTIATAANPKNRVVYRGRSADYFVVSRQLAEQQPEVAKAVIAAFVRALYWMKKSNQNAEFAANWAIAEGQSFSGKPAGFSPRQAVDVAQREILAVPSAPLIPGLGERGSPLFSEFDFLKQLGKLPENADRTRLERAFDYRGLHEVLADPRKHQVRRDDYPR